MTFLPLSSDEELSADALAAAERQRERHGGHISNTMRTLLGHVPSFEVYMGWYRLRDELEPYIGERAVLLFAYAISEANGCVVCAASFRRVLVESGDDPDNPEVTESERLLLDWGRMLPSLSSEVPAELRARLEVSFSPKLRLMLVAFAGQTVAMNLFATAGQVPLDEALVAFRGPSAE
jgi:hypothetical protein